MRRTYIAVTLAVICCARALALESDTSELARAQAVENEVERLGTAGALWPGYEPLGIPLAIYTGERTFLFRHPAPPDDFAAVEGHAAVLTTAGRHPAVTANSSADIGGRVSATLLADGDRSRLSPRALAAVALHEAFHVYQRSKHPGWSGNEGDLFLYPVEDARLLELRRLEFAALARALAAQSPADARCWSRAALDPRDRRFAVMDAAFSAYERANELNEGLAAYVEIRARGEETVVLPAEEFAPTAIRDRAYVVGPAIAFLLDRLRPGWREVLETDDRQSLDAMLAAAAAAEGDRSCSLPAEEGRAIAEAARRDAESVASDRARHLQSFAARAGWRVVVEAAEGEPLWPQGFDPLNVERVDGGVLHGRFLKLGNERGELQVIDEAGADLETLTEAAGAHPLFTGVRRVTIAGLDQPAVDTGSGAVTLRARGLTLRFTGATARVAERRITVRLGG